MDSDRIKRRKVEMNVIPQVPETIIENDIENEMREEESSEGGMGRCQVSWILV